MLEQGGGSASAARAQREMLAYWQSRRVSGRLPSRAHIDPGDFKRHLPTISLIDVRPSQSERWPRDYRLRLAGTGLYSLYGGEITGKRLSDVYEGEAEAYWRKHLDVVVEGRRPEVGLHSMAWRGAPHQTVLWLRMPLSSDGGRVDMILGYDFVLGATAAIDRSGIRAA